MMKHSGLVWILLPVLLSACAANPVNRAIGGHVDLAASTRPCVELDQAARMRLMLIEAELEAGRPRAALAHLDGLPVPVAGRPEARYLRAEAYRAVSDHARARELYQDLTTGCLAGAGFHGLGLVAAAEADVGQAHQYLLHARNLLPSDPKVRNDYGYALLLAGDTSAARIEFETVLELSERQPRAAGNLVLAMLVEGHEREALHLADAVSLDGERLQQLRRQADILRKRHSGEESE